MTDFVDVRDPDELGKLLFRYDAERALIEIQKRGRKRLIDLNIISNKQKEKDADT
ncbi:MAG: hypothetical protein V3V32_04400 [Dehalococcoidia bacterium]